MKQKIKAMLEEERGVSPVIGVILMVAITVILAAVIGTFVLGLGDSLQQAPQAQLDAEEASGDDLVISHNGGDAIPLGEIEVKFDGNTYTETDFVNAPSDELSVGDSLEVEQDPTGFTVTVIHAPSDSILLEQEL